MYTIALHYSAIQKKIKNKVKVAVFPKINWKIICFAMFFVCLSLLVYYVWQVRYLTGGSYMVNSYEKQIAQLLNEKKELEVNFAESSFLGQVQQKIRDLNFEKTTSVQYIQLPDNYLASAK